MLTSAADLLVGAVWRYINPLGMALHHIVPKQRLQHSYIAYTIFRLSNLS